MTAQRLIVACPHCATKLAVAPSSQGQTLRCGKCQNNFRLAAPAAQKTAAPDPKTATQAPKQVPSPTEAPLQTDQPEVGQPNLSKVKLVIGVAVLFFIVAYLSWPAPEAKVVKEPTIKAKVVEEPQKVEKPKWNQGEMAKQTMCAGVTDAGHGLCRAEYDFQRYPDRALSVPTKKMKIIGSECELVLDSRGFGAVMAVTALRDDFLIEMDFTANAPNGVIELALAMPLEKMYGNSREFMYRSSGKRAGAYLAATKFTRKSRQELARLVVKRVPYIRHGIVQQLRVKTEAGQMPYITIDGAPIRWPEPTDDFKKVDPKKFSSVHLRIRAVKARSFRIHKLVVEAKPSEVSREGNPRWESLSKRSPLGSSSRSAFERRSGRREGKHRSPSARKLPTQGARPRRPKAKTRGSASK